MKKRFIFALIAALLPSQSYAGLGGHNAGSTPVPKTETVTANLASTSITIPNNFVGISWATSDVVLGILSGTSGTSLSGLVSFLGPNGVLRIGGSVADTNPAPALTQPIANGIASFLSGIGNGWTLIYNLDYGINSPSLAVTQAGYIINAMGIGNVTFQIGNEIATGSAYQTRWNSYYSSLIAAYPTMRFGATDCVQGVATASIESDIDALTPGIAGMQFVSFHYYAGSNGNYLTPKQLISTIGDGSPAGGTSWTNLNAYSSNKVRLTEFNEAAVGGEKGNSDRVMAATWYIDLMMTLANASYQGTNLHDVINPINFGHPAYYNPFVYDSGTQTFTPSPVFYGMVLFSKIQGQTVVATTKSGTGTVHAISTNNGNGNANILVTNDSPDFPVTITPGQSNSWSTASVLAIEPSSSQECSDPTATLGGATIGVSGAWTGAPATINNGDTVTLQPCGAALIQIQP